MARAIKQRKSGLDTDSSIQDVQKRISNRKRQLEQATNPESNSIDELSNELDRGNEPDSIRKIFED